MTVYDDQLVIAGAFVPRVNAENQEFKRIASWDGMTWRGLDGGMNRIVNSLAVYQGELIAGGRFSTAGGTNASGVAAWNGTEWRALQGGMGGPAIPNVRALAVYRGRLIAGGGFERAGGVLAPGIASWNGQSWSGLSTGLANGEVWALAVRSGRLFVGGTFTRVGGIDANRIAVWSVAGANANRWVALGDGVDRLSNRVDMSSSVRALFNTGNGMLVSGRFVTLHDGGAKGIGLWTESGWQALGSGFNSAPHRFETYGGELVAAGAFTIPVEGGNTTGIARWNGQVWRALGGGLSREPGESPALTIAAMSKYRGELVVAGDFTRAGSRAVGGIARWNGSRWAPLGSGVPMTGEGTKIGALATFRGELFATGTFAEIGGVTARGIAAWDGSRWRAIEGARCVYPGDMCVYQGELYINGILQIDGREQRSRLVSWNGERWRELAGRNNQRGGSLLASHQGELYTAQVGGSVVWAWNGAAWRFLPGVDRNILSLEAVAGQVMAGGFDGIAAWDGAAWQRISESSVVTAIGSYRGEVVGATSYPSNDGDHFFRLRLARPWLTRQPQGSAHVCVGETHDLVVTVAPGYDGVTYQWRHNGEPIDAPIGTHRVLVLSPLRPTDAGVYDCVVSNPCGSVTSAAAELRLCAPDYNCDGATTGADVTVFYDLWFAGNAAADFNGDGLVDNQDVVDFIAAWQGGCP
ncbi:MAG: hypothetical protein KF869_03055 [Phycisphaeraceae bacterium]|nr:hypothetical protein [Phycisphaeraceae bacterium]